MTHDTFLTTLSELEEYINSTAPDDEAEGVIYVRLRAAILAFQAERDSPAVLDGTPAA